MNWKYFYLTLTNVLNVFGGKEFKNPHMFDNRSTIVHLFEWKFTDIEKECKFLGEKYFGGVQISPIQESKIEEDNNSWYLRYQPISYKISSKSGSLEEFQQMITTCHEHKIRIYVDVVLNQMANGENEIIGYNGSTAEPTRLNYPAVPYTSFDFNEFCYLLNKSDAFEIRNCRLADLPDLNQAKDNVRSKIVEFLNKLIEYGVAGFRIDAVNVFNHENHRHIIINLDVD
jgi:alpha-amylase